MGMATICGHGDREYLRKPLFPKSIKTIHGIWLRWAEFERINLSNVGPRSNNELDPWYSQVYTHLVSYMH